MLGKTVRLCDSAMSSECFEDGKVAAATAQKTDRTAGEKVARVDLVTYLGLPRKKLRERLVKCRIDEMKTFCRNSGLKVPACKKLPLRPY